MIVPVLLLSQTLLTLDLPGDGPVRLGVPLPAAALERGLRLVSAPGATLQWRPLSVDAAAAPERIWVELAIVGGSGRVGLRAGGVGPTPLGEAGPSCTVILEHPAGGAGEEGEAESTAGAPRPRLRREIRWTSGEVDRIEVFDGPGGVHEIRVTEDYVARAARVRVGGDGWRQAGLLPAGAEAGAGRWRARLVDLVAAVDAVACAGSAGRGDHRRGEVVTNNEFDTALAWLRLGLSRRDPAALERAWWAARHLVHVDLDRRSGLPFRHGAEHRIARPEPGHVWIRGLVETGLVFADDDLIQAGRDIARQLARQMRHRGETGGGFDRLRDEAWPLWELEQHLRFEITAPVVAAADQLAERMVRRFDPARGVLRYGEGETRTAVYRERIWQTVGIALPALRLFAARSGDSGGRVAGIVRATEERLLALWRRGGDGVPLGYAIAADEPFDPVWRSGVAEAFLMLDGLSPRSRQRLLRRSSTRNGLEAAFDAAAEDVATRFTLIGRVDWIWR